MSDHGSPDDRPGLAYAALGYLVGFVLTVIAGGIVLAVGDYDPGAQTGVGSDVGRSFMQLSEGVPLERRVMPILADTVLLIPLWIGLGGSALLYARRTGVGFVEQFRLGPERRDLVGLPIGAAAQLLLVPAIYVVVFWLFGRQDVSEAARALTNRADDPLGVAVLVLVVGLGAPFFEELFFRGLLLPALTDRFGSAVGLIGSSVVFGAVHFQLLQLPALVAFGLVAGILRIRTGRLAPAIAAHVGFNVVTLIVLLT